MNLSHDEFSILESASHGPFSIEGLALREMVRWASVVLTLQRRGLLRTSILFVSGRPDAIPVELTEEGRRFVDSLRGPPGG
jgi:hypothetical protein